MAVALLCIIAASSCLDVIQLRPELRAPAVKQDALALSDSLEELIDRGVATSHDREAAYDAVKRWRDRTASYAYARAVLAGRVVESQGMFGVALLAELEKWARASMAFDPRFRNGVARRMLGTLYVLAPASLVRHGDSEEGLELLEEQVERYPQDPQNALRLAEGYLALDDPEAAYEHLCHCLGLRLKLRPSEQRLFETLLKEAGGVSALGCQ